MIGSLRLVQMVPPLDFVTFNIVDLNCKLYCIIFYKYLVYLKPTYTHKNAYDHDNYAT